MWVCGTTGKEKKKERERGINEAGKKSGGGGQTFISIAFLSLLKMPESG